MNSLPETAAHAPALERDVPRAVPARARLRETLPLARHLGFVVVVGVAAVLNTHRLSQNGYANIFYAAGVKSMLHSWHNFFFVTFDPGGFITIDKPPLALWVQAASAKLFGYSPMSLLLPEAIIGVLAVAALYLILARRFGAAAAFIGALTLAVFPSFVAISRDNGVDPLLILLMVLACGAGLRAIETGRWRSIVWCGVLVGLAFNVKTLAAVLVVPGIAVGYLVCAPGSLPVRCGRLAVGGLAMLAVSFAWIAAVELTPASHRPYIGGSTDNTERSLTFEYNGFGRVEGQSGGPGQVVARPGARVPPHHHPRAVHAHKSTTSPNPTFLPDGRYRNPIPFGSRPSPVRLFGKGLGDQAGWMVPFALFGVIALVRLAVLERRRRRRQVPRTADGETVQDSGAPPPLAASAADPQATVGSPAVAAESRRLPRLGRRARGGNPRAAEEAAPTPWRRDPRLAGVFVLGGWFLVETIVLSLSKGIVHPYYVSALAPATGAMVGAGALALIRLRRDSPWWGITLLAGAVIGTVAVQAVLLHREQYLLWLVPVLVGGGALALVLVTLRASLAAPATAAVLGLLLIAPAAYSATTWWAPVEGTFPAAGPKAAVGDGGLGVSARADAINRALVDYAVSHHPGSRWAIFTVASDTAAPMIITGTDAAALGGYSGTDPALDGPGLARLVRKGEARYVVLGGVYSTRGGNEATQATLRACRLIPFAQWHDPDRYGGGLNLFDCRGYERGLEGR